MADESADPRNEAIIWTVGTLLVTALLTYIAWDSARDNARLAAESRTIEQAAPRAPTAH